VSDEGPIPTTRKDRFIAKLVAVIAQAIYRDVQVYWPEPPPLDGPQLTVANHFGGFSDGLVLLDALQRRPGIVARDVIWKVPVVGGLMTWIGGIPVHKPDDGAKESANDQMFASCYDALRDGGHLLIFPEGVTRNEPSIAPVKTGAARIALGARASGAEGLVVAPVGIHYEDKAALRSRVVVNVGVPLHLDEAVDEYTGSDASIEADDLDADNRAAVRDLTDGIDLMLREAAPDYADWHEARTLTAGAEIALRDQLDDPRKPVPIALRDRLANVLAGRSSERRARIIEAVEDYRSDLDALGVSDADVRARLSTGGLMVSLVLQVVAAVLVLPFAVVGAVINVVPALIVRAVSLARLSPSMQATVKPAVAIVAFGIAWGVVVWAAFEWLGIGGAAAAIILLPVYLAAVIVLAERLALMWRLIRRWRAGGKTRNVERQLDQERTAVVEAVLAL
jgi:1-acyl-sn-glycerol-3-phosphate acyltransferase